MPQHLFLGITANVALALQNVEHADAQLRRRRKDGVLARTLAVADAGEHITQGIGHCHLLDPYQLDFVRPGIMPWLANSRSITRARRNLR